MVFDPTNFNPDEYDDNGVMCDPGTYIGIIRSGKRKNDRGKPQIDLMVQPVIDIGRSEPEVVDANTAQVFDTVTLTEKAIWKVVQLCKAIGTGPFDLNSDRQFQDKVLGKPFKALIVGDTYGGVERRKVSQYLNLTDSELEAFEEWKEDSSLDTSMGSSGSSETGGKSRTDDDDIPF